MIHDRITVPSSDGYEVEMKRYMPDVIADVNPDMRRPAVVICPGGGYRHLSEREAEPVALRFVANGFNAFVAYYRLAPNHYPKPQQDVAAALACVRANADEWHTDPNRIAIMGFSAGGHAAASLGVMWQNADLWRDMGLSPENVRPNAMVLCYPVITAGEYAHRGSFENLTGTDELEAHQPFSLETLVTAQCPPTFLWHTFEDQAVPVQNSLLMAQALANCGVMAELHVFPFGRHGSALCNEQTSGTRNPQFLLPDNAGWPELAADFLKKLM